MKRYYCDLCENEVKSDSDLLKISFMDGEHPHNGSIMYTTKETCADCTKKLEIYCKSEIDDIMKIIRS